VPQLARSDVHDVHPGGVGLVDAGVPADEQRRHEGADELMSGDTMRPRSAGSRRTPPRVP